MTRRGGRPVVVLFDAVGRIGRRSSPAVQESLALPPPRDLGLLAVALAGVSASGPIMAATAAPALAIAFWRNALGAGLTGCFSLANLRQFATVDRRAYAIAAVG